MLELHGWDLRGSIAGVATLLVGAAEVVTPAGATMGTGSGALIFLSISNAHQLR